MPLITLVLDTLLVLAPVQAGQIEFVTSQLPWAAAGRGYAPPPLEVRISGTCPLSGLGYAVVSGDLPPGLALSPLGYFSGTARLTGSFDFTVRASNGCSWTAKKFTLVVASPPVLLVQPARLEFRRVSGEKAPEDGPPEEQILRVSSTWPGLSYRVTVAIPDSLDAGSTEMLWLSATPEHGVTPQNLISAATPLGSTQSGMVPAITTPPDTLSRAATGADGPAAPEDRVRVRVDARPLRPGHYSASITISAWQAVAAPTVAVDLVVGEPKDTGR